MQYGSDSSVYHFCIEIYIPEMLGCHNVDLLEVIRFNVVSGCLILTEIIFNLESNKGVLHKRKGKGSALWERLLFRWYK